MAFNRDFVLLVVVMVLEVILFQQVFVNLIVDMNHLQVIQEYIAYLKMSNNHKEKELDESEFSEKTGLASYFLNFSSAFNFCLSFIYVLCVYIGMNQTCEDNKKSFSRFCGDFSILSRFVFLWSIFKMCFSFSLLFVVLLGTNLSFADGGSVLSILAASFAFLCLNQKMCADLSTLARDRGEDNQDILYEPLSTEDKGRIV
eukprot:GFUD01011180.1.p1 GENE.GFUD01011180.1~~GFUD01011180.1.p1  ORF type:complete len:201 (+),score=33.65 GFUD01011180.1:178-780(+)